MTFSETLTLFTALTFLAATPSASVALVLARSITLGASHGIAVGVGIVAGDLVFICVVMLGLSVVAEAMGGMFTAVKYLGALYLLWLGLSLLRAHDNSSFSIDKSNQQSSLFASFFSGLVLTLGDIKAIYFYLSFLPIFVDLAALRLREALIIVAVSIVAVGGVKTLYALFASRIVASERTGWLRAFSAKAAGAALAGAASYLLFKI